ncbi:hypothetical protein [Adhaeribacter terreus]|uniref:Uncharacterized protein n=1 Tax=Adhaeribacter terreus TaxID=529703 RepID=A0ABW0E8P8_9BACT
MKKILLLLFLSFLCFFHTVFAQTPTWQWAQAGAGNNSGMESRGTGIDAAGNIYAAILGLSTGGVSFGNINLPSEYMYLVKYNKHGQVKWAKAIANCRPNALSTDAAGNSYVTGDFLDSTTIGSTTLICNGVKDIFVAKFDSSGNALWARRAGGPGFPSLPFYYSDEDVGKAIAVDTAGNCYVGGHFFISNFQTSAHNYVTFDTITYSLPASYNNYRRFSFLAKYNAAGHIQWMRRVETKKPDEAFLDMAISKQGNLFVIGAMYDTLTFNNQPPLISHGSDDGYYARFDPNGNPI